MKLPPDSLTWVSAHVRYAIPALPFFFIWCGKLFVDAGAPRAVHRERPLWRSTVCRELTPCRSAVGPMLAWFCLIAAAIEGLYVYPHSISFFNLLIGGPRHGHEWLLDSNSAWGQDLIYLNEWVERHPEARPLRLATVGWLDPAVLGIDYTLPPVGPSRVITDDDRLRVASGSRQRAGSTPNRAIGADHRAPHDDTNVPQTWQDVRALSDLGPQPGWYAIDVNFLHGTDWPATWPGWRFQKIAEEGLNYEYFRLVEPCDCAAYSYLIYHLTPEQAAGVRHALGLP